MDEIDQRVNAIKESGSQAHESPNDIIESNPTDETPRMEEEVEKPKLDQTVFQKIGVNTLRQ